MAKANTEQAQVAVFVTPKAGKDAVDGFQEDADGAPELKIRVRALPDEGRANKAVCEVLARHLRVPKSAVTVAAGHTSRHKRLVVAGISQAELETRLEVVK